MRRMSAPGRCATTSFLATVAFLFITASASAVNVTDIDARLGLLLMSNGYVTDSAGNQVQFSEVSPLLGAVGGDVALSINSRFSFRPALDIYGLEYAETASGKVVPTQAETKNAALVLSLLLSSPFSISWQLNPALTISAGFSPTLLIRFPVISYGSPDLTAITSYFYKDARFVYPEFDGTFDYAFRTWLHIVVNLRVLLPVFHIWDGESVPFTDQMVVAGSILLRFPLHPRSAASTGQ